VSRTRIFIFDLLCLIGFVLMIFGSAFGEKVGLTIGAQWYVIAAFWLGFGHHVFQRKAIEARWMGHNKPGTATDTSSTFAELAELRKQYNGEKQEHGPR